MNASTLVQKLLNYCNIMQDYGMSYGDDVRQKFPTISSESCNQSKFKTVTSIPESMKADFSDRSSARSK